MCLIIRHYIDSTVVTESHIQIQPFRETNKPKIKPWTETKNSVLEHHASTSIH